MSELWDYFNNLYSSSHSEADQIDWILPMEAIQPKITEDMNLKLNEPFTMEEIRFALFQMHPDKAPGIDGFSALFYQKLWDVIKNDVCEEILKFLNDGILDPNINATQIILLPKKEKSLTVEDFRPISLCNVIMKLITKVLANRLGEFLPAVISPNQSAFLKSRLITDNILIAQEACHFVKNRKLGSDGFISLKADMSKAYDRVEWSFMRSILLKMGFNHSWTCKVMFCVESVSYQLKVNGNLSDKIFPSRGLRQGILYPLSCSLFAKSVYLPI